jgi:RNA polymerase sigma-70 factor (ECF subfamily)
MIKRNSEQRSSEDELILSIKSGDSAAFQELFFTYCQPLIRFAHRFVNDVALAEDIVQDVFLKIWSNRQQLEPALNIKSYLYVAVKNQAFKQLRHKKIRQALGEKPPFSPLHTPTPEEIFNSKEVESTVLKAIEELPDKCRLIFSMNRFDSLTYSEIAEIMNLSVKTIETQMGRALVHLRQRLQQFIHLMIAL